MLSPSISQLQKMLVVQLSAVSHMKSTEDALLLFAADSHFPVSQWPGLLVGREESKI